MIGRIGQLVPKIAMEEPRHGIGDAPKMVNVQGKTAKYKSAIHIFAVIMIKLRLCSTYRLIIKQV